MEIHFAPLQGHTNAVYRALHAKLFGGVDCYYSPFVRVEKGLLLPHFLHDLQPILSPFVPQILAGSAEELHLLVERLYTLSFRSIDLNFGCPFPPISRRGRGAGILPSPSRVESLLTALSHYPQITFSVKMRLGLHSPHEILPLIPLLNASVISHITLHPRLGAQMYRGDVDMESFSQAYEKIEKPLFYNGDLRESEEAFSLLARFPHLKGISIGRGLLSRPSLAREIASRREESPESRIKSFEAFHHRLFTAYAKIDKINEIPRPMSGFWEYIPYFLSTRWSRKSQKCSHREEYERYVERIFTEADV